MKYSFKLEGVIELDNDMNPGMRLSVTPEVKPPTAALPPSIPSIPSKLSNPDHIRLEDFNSWNQAINQHGKILVLEPKKEYAIEGYQSAEPKLKAIVGHDANLVFGKGPQSIFSIDSDGLDFGTVGVNFLQRADTKIKPATNTKILFRTNHLTVKTGKLAMIGSKAPDDSRLTVQLAWAFSGTNGGDDGLLHIIGKDLRCNGPDFMNLKANAGGGLYSTLINVTLNNPDTFNPNEIGVEGYITGDRFHITSDHLVSDVLSHYGYQNGNIRTLLHIGRFVFNINDRAVISDKEIRLFSETDPSYTAINRNTFGCRLDLQPGDVTTLGRIISKQLSVVYGWEYKTDTGIELPSGSIQILQAAFTLSGLQKAFLIYKGNSFIGSYAKDLYLNEQSKFGDWQIIIGAKYGHTSYNHSYIGGYWENLRHGGMYRQSDPEPQPIGSPCPLTIQNCKGLDGYTDRWGNFIRSQFKPAKSSTERLHPDAAQFISYLEDISFKTQNR